MLYIVPTPIGNLKDITLRAIEVLEHSELILAEDTRHTGLLMRRLGLKKEMQSLHSHNEKHKTNAIVSKTKPRANYFGCIRCRHATNF